MRQTSSINNLQTIQFDLTIERLPEVEFRVQQASLPGFSFSPAGVATPFRINPMIGDSLEQSNLTIGFQVDENLRTWESIWDWMKATNPNSFDEHNQAKFKGSLYSDISLMIMNSMKNVTATFKFIDAFPISMSEISLNTTQTSVEYSLLNVEFVYSSLTMERNR